MRRVTTIAALTAVMLTLLAVLATSKLACARLFGVRARRVPWSRLRSLPPSAAYLAERAARKRTIGIVYVGAILIALAFYFQ